MSEPQKQFDPIAWIERLRYVNETSAFTASERALIEERLADLQSAVRNPKPFVEGARK